MPTETEELRLVVNLTDNASGPLARLRQELGQLGGGGSGTGLEKIHQDTQKLGEHFKGLGNEVTRAGQAVAKLMTGSSGLGVVRQEMEHLALASLSAGRVLSGAFGFGVGFGVGALATLGVELAKQIYQLPQWSRELRNAAMAAQSIGVNAAQMNDVVKQLQAQGISAEAATQSIAGMAAAIADLSKAGGQLRPQLLALTGFGNQGASAGMQEFIDQLLKAQSVAERTNLVLAASDNVRLNALREGKTEIVAAANANAFAAKLGVDRAVAQAKSVQQLSAEEQRRYDELNKGAKEFADLLGHTGSTIGKIADMLMAPMLGPNSPLVMGLKVVDELVTGIYTMVKTIGYILNPDSLFEKGAPLGFLGAGSPQQPGAATAKPGTPRPMNFGSTGFGTSQTPAVPGAAVPGAGTHPPAQGGASGFSGNMYTGLTSADNAAQARVSSAITSGGATYAVGDRPRLVDENTAQLRRLNDNLEEITGTGTGTGTGGRGGGALSGFGRGGAGLGGGGGGGGGQGGAGSGGEGSVPSYAPGGGTAPTPRGDGGRTGTPPEAEPPHVGATPPMGEKGAAAVAGAPDAHGMYNYFQKTGAAKPKRSDLTTLTTPYGKIAVHPQAAADFTGFTNELKEAGAPIKKFGSYADRAKRWGGGTSSHAYGAALDIDDATALSPQMKNWIAQNQEKWKQIKEKWNIGQPLTDKTGTGGKDAPHVEWRGPHGSKMVPNGQTAGPGVGAGAGDTAATAPTAGTPLTAGAKGGVDPKALEGRLTEFIKGSGLEGMVPQDAARYGIKTGSPEEWASLMTGIAGKESSYNTNTVGDKGSFDGGSRGLFQLSPQDAISYGIQKTPFTKEQLADPDFNARMAVIIAAKRAEKGGIGGAQGMAKYWAGQKGYLAQGGVGVDRAVVDAVKGDGAQAAVAAQPDVFPGTQKQYEAYQESRGGKGSMLPPNTGINQDRGIGVNAPEGYFSRDRGIGVNGPGGYVNPDPGITDRAQLDRAQSALHKVEGTGKITVDVNAPRGTNVGVEAGGLFRKTEINRQTQMERAQSGPRTIAA